MRGHWPCACGTRDRPKGGPRLTSPAAAVQSLRREPAPRAGQASAIPCPVPRRTAPRAARPARCDRLWRLLQLVHDARTLLDELLGGPPYVLAADRLAQAGKPARVEAGGGEVALEELVGGAPDRLVRHLFNLAREAVAEAHLLAHDAASRRRRPVRPGEIDRHAHGAAGAPALDHGVHAVGLLHALDEADHLAAVLQRAAGRVQGDDEAPRAAGMGAVGGIELGGERRL